MSNSSLKDQLQALSVKFSPPGPEAEKPVKNGQNGQSGQTNNKAKKKISWLEYAQYGVELLKAHFPHCFKEPAEIQPLKVGIKQDLVKALSTREDIVICDKACMVSSLAFYVNAPAYHRCVVKDSVRIDLDGQSAGTVTESEAQYSSEYRKVKAQKKKPAPQKNLVNETK